MTNLNKFKKTIILAIFIYIFTINLAFALDERIDTKLLNIEGKTSVIVTFSKKPANYKNFIKSVGGEVIYDYNSIEGLAIKVDGKNISKLLNMSNVLRIQEDKKVKALLDDSAPMISADKAWEQGFTGKDVKVCILDTGIDYTHPALGSCSLLKINGTIEPKVVESKHPYPTYCDGIKEGCTWTITKLGYTSIAVHFVNISMENGYDFIYIKDANGNIVQTFTGDYKDVWSVSVPGDTIKINLVSDWYGCKYGFYVDKVLNGTIHKTFENCTKVISGYDFVNNDNDPMDDNGHGTHVAGIISSDDQIYRGIANGTKLMIAKVLDSTGSGTYSSVMAGIDWCANNSAQIISMSLGGDAYQGTCDNDSLAQAVNNAVDNGIVVSVSAGNEGQYGLTTPACASKALAVGAVDKNSSVVGYSSKGSELDIVAPGHQIKSTVPGGWGYMSGTSMAAPHVAGVIALMLEANPMANIDNIRTVLSESSDPVNKCYECTWSKGDCTNYYGSEIPCTENVTGAGIINASRAVNMISVDFLPPRYSNIKEPVNPSNYSLDASYNFSIKWIDDKAVDTVILEFNGENYTDLNKNGSYYYKIFEDLPAGFYTYRWYANDTSNKWNSTDFLSFTINKATPVVKLSLNNLEGNITVLNQSTIVNYTAQLITPIIGVIELWTNYSDGIYKQWKAGASPLVNLTNMTVLGTYRWTANFTGNQNYTGSTETWYVTVTNVTRPVITILSPGSTYYTPNIPLIFTINKPASWCGYSLDGASNKTITGCTNTTLTGLSYSTHNIIIYANDTSGNMGNSSKVYFTISKIGGGGCGRNCLLT